MRHGSLFSGIGGFDLAAQWMGWENVFHCELNEFGRRVLKYYWPLAKSYDDITKTDFIIWLQRLGILTGGFSCQGFSLAGSRLGTDDYRYLWPEMLRVVRQTRPTWIVGENVAGIKSMEDKSGVWKDVFARVENRKVVRYDTVDLYEAVYTRQVKMLVSTICEDLEKEGYQVQPIIIPAAAIGAPHKREKNLVYCTLRPLQRINFHQRCRRLTREAGESYCPHRQHAIRTNRRIWRNGKPDVKG